MVTDLLLASCSTSLDQQPPAALGDPLLSNHRHMHVELPVAQNEHEIVAGLVEKAARVGLTGLRGQRGSSSTLRPVAAGGSAAAPPRRRGANPHKPAEPRLRAASVLRVLDCIARRRPGHQPAASTRSAAPQPRPIVRRHLRVETQH
eukprot:282402-Rhodomonas_salina.2